MLKTVLITGAAGFIGSHLVDRCLDESYTVIGIDNLSTGCLSNLSSAFKNPHFHFQVEDVRDVRHIHTDQIFNLACPASPIQYKKDPHFTFTSSVIGALKLIEIAKNRKCTIIQASTSEIYGDPEVHPQREDYCGYVNPIGERSCYDEGKRAAETIFHDANRSWGMDNRTVRIFNTYGPRMAFEDGRVISSFIHQSLTNKPITIFGDGSQTRSFCFITDLIDGLFKVSLLPSLDGPINLGNPNEITISELATLVLNSVTYFNTNKSSDIQYLPLTADDPKKRCPDITKANNLLGWYPITNIQEGLYKTLSDFKERLCE